VSAGKALVLGDDTRGFLATVRSLGRRGIRVHVAPANFRSPALRSRYVSVVHDLPPWLGDGAAWLSAIKALLLAERFDVIIPCDETTLLPLQRHREELSELAHLAIPDDHSIAVLFDKHATRQLAQQVGAPVAFGRLLEPDDTAEALLAEFGSPIVVKPRRSYALETLASRGKAQIVSDAASLARAMKQLEPRETLLERFFPGQGMGVSLLASDGRVLQAFEHHRVREFAGASFYRVSAPLATELAQGCAAMVAALRYTGVAMFELKRAASGKWVLLEVNARPWGSMPLPVALGVDFPYRWYRLLTASEETLPVDYRSGIYGRNLVPDLRASKAEAEKRQLGPVATALLLARRTVELARVLTGREVHDLLVRDDPRPGLIELVEIGSDFQRKLAKKLPGMEARERRRVWAQVANSLCESGRSPQVVFVCQGNICRSPFAAALFRTRLARRDAIAVASAGMMPWVGRSSPALAQETAAQFGIDLSGHRSVWLSREKAEAASVLVVFDETNRSAVLDRYPQLKVPVVRLDQLGQPGEISDPIDGGPAEFKRCYALIAAGVEEFGRMLTNLAGS
jgi:protein-tyrosine-phosphatase/predicted ATP-grasp superfamily ATP-dependent carboligase